MYGETLKPPEAIYQYLAPTLWPVTNVCYMLNQKWFPFLNNLNKMFNYYVENPTQRFWSKTTHDLDLNFLPWHTVSLEIFMWLLFWELLIFESLASLWICKRVLVQSIKLIVILC